LALSTARLFVARTTRLTAGGKASFVGPVVRPANKIDWLEVLRSHSIVRPFTP
jgi:hypothetical protein